MSGGKYNLLRESPSDELIIRQTISDMFNKKLLPERSRKLIYDSMPQLLQQYRNSPFKEFSCNKDGCAFTARGPKFLLIQHQKTHADKKDIRENETLRNNYKLY